ncbi:hypothetical protein QOZ80_9AG0675200 [Eleusine coracana subsp. coracana]|nr:hypothetical protein QOZ80_9AG0675190 [Eleusine coracana subsp. coracana]KAK3119789.1 hypothetical protein QOZ80_9AG0675200 [Eleusine coracana subsp. coracana]
MNWLNNGKNIGAGGSGARGAPRNLQLQVVVPPAAGVEMDADDGNNSSPPSSCVSSDDSPSDRERSVIAACSRCTLYIMVSVKEVPVCINCKEPNLVDIFHSPALAAKAMRRSQRK